MTKKKKVQLFFAAQIKKKIVFRKLILYDNKKRRNKNGYT